ncbi:MAG TPA: DUF5668 domain-containing protein [Bacteroidales bacterium]|nr:DUF5668 domain-containing protein [Bacteroidales bacterium]
MKHQNIFWGGVLVVAGVLLLLSRLDVFSIDWWTIGKLWPFLLVFWGVSILPVKGMYKVAITLVLAGAVVLVYMNAPVRERETKEYSISSDWGDDDDTIASGSGQLFTEPWEDGVDEAALELNAAAGAFRLGGTTGELIVGRSEGNHARYTYKVERTGRSANINIREEGHRRKSRTRGSDFSMMLNPQPVWQFKFDIGAADFDFDLTEFRIAKLDINAGASSIKLKIGDKHPATYVDIDAGASSVSIEIPENSGCVLSGSTVLSSRDLDGFDKISKGKYQTPGFETAEKKIYIKVDAAVSSFEIRRVSI